MMGLVLWLSNVLLVSGKVVYVSSSTGSNINSGLQKEYPVRNISVALNIGDSIYLHRGDIFYEYVILKNSYMSSYGSGSLPIICGYKHMLKPQWERVGDNIWKISLTTNNFDGHFVGEQSSMLNNIGAIHDCMLDSIHGRKVMLRELLKENWDIWQTEHYSVKDTKSSDFDILYLYLDRDPNMLQLDFSIGMTGVSMNNSTIENVRIEGFGRHGISAGTKSIIRKCEIDAIGGMTQTGYENFTSLGNGIEFYVSTNITNCLVEQCKISRCYDCGITIQGTNCGQATPSNIIIRDNLITDCCQGWEDFLRNDDNVMYINCVFRNNVVLNSGHTSGFNYPSRFKYCHILGNNFKGNRGMVIEKNTFVGGNYYCSGAYKEQYKSNVWRDNVCYIKRGDYILSNYFGTADVIRISTEKGRYESLKAATDVAISRYREMTGDMTTQFIIEKEGKINKRIAKLKKKYL